MGKGKKKANKGKKKRGGKKTRDDVDSPDDGESPTYQITLTREHVERARLAASNRTEDPLKNWTRLLNEECPICMLPLPLNEYETNYCVTCGKTICAGCVASVGIAHMRDSGDADAAVEKAMTCPYCRSDIHANNDCKYTLEQEMKRANAENGEAMFHVGTFYFDGLPGLLQQDKAEGLKWYHLAVEAGYGHAAFYIAKCYLRGECVDQDIDKALEYFQKAAELGYIPAFSLSCDLLMKKGDIEEAMLNSRKAVICGMSDDYLFDMLREVFKVGFITKDEYAYTLREHHDARNEMKSDARESWRRRK